MTTIGALGALAVATATLGAGGAAARTEPPTVGGGSGIVIDQHTTCTLTTVGHDSAGRLVGLTAGHCGEPGAAVSTEADPDYGVVGRFVRTNHELDYAVIEFAPDRITPSTRVGNLSIADIGAPTYFPTVVCKKGRTTGDTCGVTWGDIGGPSDRTWTQLCVLEGDSGAPIVSGATLVGMVNAYYGVGCFGPEVGTDIHAILADLNAGSEVGAGFQPN
ncbi:S1 family peptidase [Nocardia sp. NPDC005366]|uniref:S1 family peptidase n=1 Tax=Nocardia sp. NPDC005366 TaxID=3156878 RepID=UPI0033A97D49